MVCNSSEIDFLASSCAGYERDFHRITWGLWAEGSEEIMEKYLMIDDLVKRLRDDHVAASRTDAADRILELEEALAKAVEALRKIAGKKNYADDPWGIARIALKEIDGESHEV